MSPGRRGADDSDIEEEPTADLDNTVNELESDSDNHEVKIESRRRDDITPARFLEETKT